MKVKDFEEKQDFEGYLLVTKAEQKTTSANAPYLSLSFQDDTGSIDANLWTMSEHSLNVAQVGQVVHVKAGIIKYKNSLQLKIVDMQLPTLIANPADFVKRSPIAHETLVNEVEAYLSLITDADCKVIIDALYAKYRDGFYLHPAAVRNHHEFAAGLATHTLEMFKLAQGILSIYPQLDASLVYSGIFLHDLGKMRELTSPIAPTYSIEGNLIGHISMMQSEVELLAESLGLVGSESVMLLRHIVLSHHGKLEYGSPVLPMIPEAEMVNLIDIISARMNVMDKALEGLQPGEFSSRIFALDQRMMYKRKG